MMVARRLPKRRVRAEKPLAEAIGTELQPTAYAPPSINARKCPQHGPDLRWQKNVHCYDVAIYLCERYGRAANANAAEIITHERPLFSHRVCFLEHPYKKESVD